MPNDGGNLLLSPEERELLIADSPKSEKFIRPMLGAEDFLNGGHRYCLWLVDADPSELRQIPEIMRRIEAVRSLRLNSSRETTKKLSSTPSLFGEIRQPKQTYLAIPRVSSENRAYIPWALLPASTIAGDRLAFLPKWEMWQFGVLQSEMHMAWVRVVSGRLKSDFQYSNKVVYNNLPWPEPDAKQLGFIEKAAQAVLDARAPHLASGNSLADLYNPLLMPPDLLKAHQTLDQAVDKAYRTAPFGSERERVEFLFARYEKLTAPLAPAKKAKGRAKTT